MTDITTVLDYIGYIEIIIAIIIIILGIIAWLKGILPVLIRLGNGLAKRKIAIFAKADNLTSLRCLLIDSKLFDKKNIYGISKKDDFENAKKATIFLVYWHDFENEIDLILNEKEPGTALIIYAPYNLGRIPEDQMCKLDGKRDTAVSNFRGRLLNDIVTSMITTNI